ncbi:hypothetical protein SDJN03_17671, partial [Cucurbita argyrosperma subsp. sororia]
MNTKIFRYLYGTGGGWIQCSGRFFFIAAYFGYADHSVWNARWNQASVREQVFMSVWLKVVARAFPTKKRRTKNQEAIRKVGKQVLGT